MVAYISFAVCETCPKYFDSLGAELLFRSTCGAYIGDVVKTQDERVVMWKDICNQIDALCQGFNVEMYSGAVKPGNLRHWLIISLVWLQVI